MLSVCVIRVSSYASQIIEIQDNERVIDSGPYSLIRNSMYLAVLIMYITGPVLPGSCHALIPMISLPFIMVSRINAEEKILSDGLAGYRVYMGKVKYRLILSGKRNHIFKNFNPADLRHDYVSHIQHKI